MNPFDITKAVDYSDTELYNNWVDFPKDGFNNIIRPTLDMPMIILGSKGSGKTHIMKHFSFKMQQLRNKEIYKGIITDGYIGIYLRCSGLNGYRFSDRNESPDTWEAIFSYYLDLWLTQLLLDSVVEIFNSNNELKKYENRIVMETMAIFNSNEKLENYNFKLLKEYINHQQRKIDYAINNIALSSGSIKDKIEILANPGQLIFEVPLIITKVINEFSKIKILFLLDEFENFSESQQKYFNTLIRERQDPVCFKIGARRYGIKTKMTFSGGEEIKVGSEYELFDLDDIFRKNLTDYKEFLKEICIKRIENSNNKLSNDIIKHFDTADYNKDMQVIRVKSQHIEKFKNKLKKYKVENFDKITANIRCQEDPLIERVNIYLIYKGFKKKENLFELSKNLKRDTKKYLQGESIEDYDSVLDKYKQDLIDALYRENSLKITSYCGFDNLVRISNGIPRHFLMIMKHIFRWNNFYENNSYKDTIKTDIQLLAIKDTVLWFLEDANTRNSLYNFKDCIERLCNYLRELRYSDLPPECSISTIELESSNLKLDVKEIIDFLEQYSYLIKIESGRRDKNSNQRNDIFQVNGLISCLWELAIARRGIVKISESNLEIILTNSGEELKRFSKSELIKYNIPFKHSNELPSLF
ncbi:MAG: hypothetical protein P0Y62_16770 [Candidatus Chryseobacterium colombiense]|nr:hypothetical protein [Chryseobacterium sp.]WEK69475.1 MAG: hypothetical protein P0Y62_16770 [Chryseobacterium sp.]